MIKLIENPDCLSAFEFAEPYWAAITKADALAFQNDPELMNVWAEYDDDRPDSVLKCDGNELAVLTKGKAPGFDAMLFIGKLIENKNFTINCSEKTADVLKNAFELKSEETVLMKCQKRIEADIPNGLKLCKDPPFDEIFSLFSEISDNGTKEFWELKLRRGIAKGMVTVFALYDGETPVSCAMIRGRTKTGGAVASVITKPEYRGRGCASYLVAACSNMLLDEERTPWLIPVSKETQKIYSKLGFLPVSRYYTLTAKEEDQNE